jgi:hypothetical protein
MKKKPVGSGFFFLFNENAKYVAIFTAEIQREMVY